MEGTKKRKPEEQQADEETPAKIPQTQNDSEFENFLSNTANSEISSEEDPMDAPLFIIVLMITWTSEKPSQKN